MCLSLFWVVGFATTPMRLGSFSGSKPNALLHFKEYAKQHPDDEQLKQKIAEIERSNIRIVPGPPPNLDETTKKK